MSSFKLLLKYIFLYLSTFGIVSPFRSWLFISITRLPHFTLRWLISGRFMRIFWIVFFSNKHTFQSETNFEKKTTFFYNFYCYIWIRVGKKKVCDKLLICQNYPKKTRVERHANNELCDFKNGQYSSDFTSHYTFKVLALYKCVKAMCVCICIF